MARPLPREPGVRAAPAWRSPKKAGQRPGSGRGGGRAARGARTGRAAPWTPRSRAPGAAPARRWSQPSPAAHRAARVRAVRTPAAPRLRPVSRRVSRGGGHSGPGKRPAPARHAAERPSSSAGAPASAPKPSVPAARGPRVPSALGRRRFARCFRSFRESLGRS